MERPHAILFACTFNAVRSPMAEALMKQYHGREVWVQSAGVTPETIDPFAVAVMSEIGVDLSHHRARGFDELEDGSFDLVVALSTDAQRAAIKMTRASACDVEFWEVIDPSIAEGDRETRLDAYRQLRDALRRRILARFPLTPGAAAGADRARGKA